MPAMFALHKQQLFHWIGRHIDEEKLSQEQKAERYVEALKGSLKHGIWVKSPGKPEGIWLGGKTQPLTLPMMAWFTAQDRMPIAARARRGQALVGMARQECVWIS